ncbi:MAG: histidine kinase dimerization/phospho-acceptor domain-containing protein [Anaerostipes sp.]|nr:HAMP domain-containing sensor histidine kinase [uncultured Anaerostipes sp.]
MKKKLLKNQSVRVKMTLMLIIIMTSVIALSVLVNLTMLKTYYTVKEKKTIKESYVQLQKIFKKDTVRENEVDEIAKKYNYRIMISNSTGSRAYSSEGQNSVMYKGLWNIMNNNLDKISDEINKQGYAIMTNSNKSMGTSINLIGYLDGDFTVIISTPMESIQTSARLSGQFTMYVGLILIICGAIAMYLYSRQFTKPIEDMAKAANQMSHLDFDMKVPTGSDDELGRLGNSINELSSKLELTISELKTANNELQKDIEQKVQIDEMRKEFLSHVSHELKTPIALIQGYSEGLKDNILDDEESKEFYCDVIADEAKKMNRMVQKLLTLNQIEFGNNQVNMERFDITEMIRNMVESSKILVEKQGVTIIFDEPEMHVWADEFMIEEVVNNYLSNARNHVTDGGIIKVSYCQNGNNLRVKVFNTGNHIPQEDIDKLWVKFYKVDKARTREYGGSGIGLSIVEATMKAHGRDYGVANVEGGVEFYFEVESADSQTV